MTTRILSATAALSLCFMGCTAADDDLGGRPRGGIGKADTVGSCVDTSCDGQAPDGNCWCDDKCADYGDCCDDYEPACNYIQCGGFAGLPCPEGLVCVDYPLDECDPNAGGADCGGMCVEQQKTCGGFAGLTCGEGEFCYYEADASCGFADQTGVCKVKPDFCMELYAPVCGCNGQTYSNECFANSAGTSAASQGECAPQTCLDAGGFCVESPTCPADTVQLEQSCGSVGGICCKPWTPTPPPPATNSCEGHCGSAAGSCYCDDQCAGYGDCCDDYQDVCGREIASGMCVKNSLDECETDADCVAGGCGGELCYNSASGNGISTCECSTPTGPTGCGCVAGQCAWYN